MRAFKVACRGLWDIVIISCENGWRQLNSNLTVKKENNKFCFIPKMLTYFHERKTVSNT